MPGASRPPADGEDIRAVGTDRPIEGVWAGRGDEPRGAATWGNRAGADLKLGVILVVGTRDGELGRIDCLGT